MTKAVLNYEITKLGEIEQAVNDRIVELKRLQITSQLVGIISSNIRNLERIKLEISDERLSLFEVILDLPNSDTNSESDSDQSNDS